MVALRWESATRKFGFIKQVDIGRIASVKDLESWRFERKPFVRANRGIVGCCRFLWGCGRALTLVEIWWHEFWLLVFVQRILVRAKNNVWQMGEYVFLWHLPSPSHLNQLFCNLHDLWNEFSECLERRLLKRRITVALSDLASRTYARVEQINLIRI